MSMHIIFDMCGHRSCDHRVAVIYTMHYAIEAFLSCKAYITPYSLLYAKLKD